VLQGAVRVLADWLNGDICGIIEWDRMGIWIFFQTTNQILSSKWFLIYIKYVFLHDKSKTKLIYLKEITHI
jgi:hypothetical protein